MTARAGVYRSATRNNKVVQPGSNVTSDLLACGYGQLFRQRARAFGPGLHPQFSTNRRFFVYYTRLSDGALEGAEYKTFTGNPNQGDPATARPIITIPHTWPRITTAERSPSGRTGSLHGPGDAVPVMIRGRRAEHKFSARQNITHRHRPPSADHAPYGSPPTNPYVGVAGADEIYAIGMRNPYRFSFDKGGTNQLWVGDVGQDAIEEVDTIVLGGNYGWRVYEGDQCTGNDPGLCTPSNYLPRVFQYNSGAPDPRCSVTGGYVYRGVRRALPVGQYIYADYCTGEIYLWNGVLDPAARYCEQYFFIGQDEDGEIYVVGLGGTVDRIIGAKTSV